MPGGTTIVPPVTCATSRSDSAITRHPPPPPGGAPEPPRRGRRRGAPRLRRPARSRGPCRRRRRSQRPLRPRRPRPPPRWPRGGRPPRARPGRDRRPGSASTPSSTAARMAAGSSERGLSSVTTTRSATSAAAAPIRCALVAVAVTAGAGDDHQAPGGGRAQGPQGGPDRLRRVGVVDDGAGRVDPVGGRHRLHPARHVRVGEHRLADGTGILAEQHQSGRRHRRVGDVEVAGKARPQVQVDPGSGEAEGGRVVRRRPGSASRRRLPCRSC